jgi:hypothetical protein
MAGQFLVYSVVKVYFGGGIVRNGCLLISFGKLFSTIFEGLKKIITIVKKFFQHSDKNLS